MRNSAHSTRFAVVLVVGLVGSTAALLTLGALANRKGKANSTKEAVMVADAGRLSKQIAKSGPVFLNTLLDKDNRLRPVVIAKLSKTEWAAMATLPPGTTDLKCAVNFDKASNDFVDPCTQQRYALNGQAEPAQAGQAQAQNLQRFAAVLRPGNILTVNFDSTADSPATPTSVATQATMNP